MAVTKPNANLILVTGGTALSPNTMQGIYNADVSNSWGNVTKLGDSTFFINCNLQIGDGTTPTYVRSFQEDIIIGTSSARRTYKVQPNATFQLGALDSQGFGINGSRLSIYEAWVAQRSNFTLNNTETYNNQRGNTLFYGSNIRFVYAYFVEMDFADGVDFRDSNINAGSNCLFSSTSSGQIRRCNFSVNTLFYIYTPNITLDAVNFIGQTEGILSGGSSVLRNIDFGTKDLRRYYSADINLYDCIIDNSKIITDNSGGTRFIYKHFTHTVAIKDASNTAVQDVQLRLSDDLTSGERYNLATNASGEIAGQEVTAQTFTCVGGVATLEDKTNHTLRVRKFGYKFQSIVVELNNKINTSLFVDTDSLLTETTKATIDVYTVLDTNAKLYDYSRSWLSQSGNMQYADVFNLVGDAIDFGSVDVVIDATASNVLDFDGATVTIKATAFTGNLTTTGTVSVSNGAVIDGIISDTNGTTGILKLN